MIGRDGLLWVEGRNTMGPPFLLGLRPSDGSEVWRVEHAEDSLFFPALDCRNRLFLGGGGNQVGLPASITLQAFTFTQTGSAPQADSTYTADVYGLGGTIPPVYSTTWFYSSCMQLVTPWIETVETQGRSVLFGGRVRTTYCTTSVTSGGATTTCSYQTLDTVLLFNTKGTPALGLLPTRDTSIFTYLPSSLDTVNGNPPIVARLQVDNHEHGFLLGRNANLRDWGLSGLGGIPGHAVSADKWTIAGTAIFDVNTGSGVASYPIPEHVVCPPTIGLDGYWYVVDLSGRLYAFDVPGLPEGPLPLEDP